MFIFQKGQRLACKRVDGRIFPDHSDEDTRVLKFLCEECAAAADPFKIAAEIFRRDMNGTRSIPVEI